MKIILLNDKMILRERMRQIDRLENKFSASFSVEPAFGVNFNSELQSLMISVSIFIVGKENPDLWNLVKNSSQQEMVDISYRYLMGPNNLYLAYIKHHDYLKNPKMETVQTTDASGNIIPNGSTYEVQQPSGFEDKIAIAIDEGFQNSVLPIFQLFYATNIKTISLVDI